MNPRTCIVTGYQRKQEDMIRFVLDPEGKVTPDIKGKLPGRGLWVTAEAVLIEQAVREKRFSKGFRREVLVEPNLAELVDSLLEASAFHALGMVKKAGFLVTGFDKVVSALKQKRVQAVMHASDAAKASIDKLASSVTAASANSEVGVQMVEDMSGEQLDRVLGQDNATHLALIQSGATENFLEKLKFLREYRAGTCKA